VRRSGLPQLGEEGGAPCLVAEVGVRLQQLLLVGKILQPARSPVLHRLQPILLVAHLLVAKEGEHLDDELVTVHVRGVHIAVARQPQGLTPPAAALGVSGKHLQVESLPAFQLGGPGRADLVRSLETRIENPRPPRFRLRDPDLLLSHLGEKAQEVHPRLPVFGRRQNPFLQLEGPFTQLHPQGNDDHGRAAGGDCRDRNGGEEEQQGESSAAGPR
jgi:hypothetical protein